MSRRHVYRHGVRYAQSRKNLRPTSKYFPLEDTTNDYTQLGVGEAKKEKPRQVHEEPFYGLQDAGPPFRVVLPAVLVGKAGRGRQVAGGPWRVRVLVAVVV